MRALAALLAAAVLAVAVQADAQDTGPAPSPPTPEAPPDPHADPSPPANPHGDTNPLPSHGSAMDQRILRAISPPEMARAEPAAELPEGELRVHVFGPDGAPVAAQEVQLGVMQQGGERQRRSATTGADGIAVFADLPVGEAQAYRANVPVGGVVTSSFPFRMEPSSGMRVRIPLLPATSDTSSLLLFGGQVVVELREGRLHVLEQLQLSNLDARVVVLPPEGLALRLPQGATAFESERVMTDQRIREEGGSVRIVGSLPPGQVSLGWAFDVPITGSEMQLELGNPFRTFQFRVIASAARGMRLSVDGMPDAVPVENEGEHFSITEARWSPSDPPPGTVRLRLTEVPTRGPTRWIAVGGALAVLALGMLLWARPRRGRQTVDLDPYLDELRTLERDAAAGDVGPETRQKERARIVDRMAEALRDARGARPSS